MSQSNPTDVELDAYCGNYVLYGDQSRAFRVAFPDSKATPESTHTKASKFHVLVEVQSRIKELSDKAREIAEKEFKLDAAYVAKKLKEIAELDVLDIMTHDLKHFRPLNEWPKEWRTSISGLDLMTMSSNDENIESIIRKVKWPDKTKNIELIGKLTEVSAFTENMKVENNMTMTPWSGLAGGVDE